MNFRGDGNLVAIIINMNSIHVYGLQSCDNTRKALASFKRKNIDILFHDLKAGITDIKLEDWCKQVGWEKILNRKSTTWRSLPKEVQDTLRDEGSAIKLMLEYTSLVKRPVIELNNRITVGLSENFLPNNKNK